MQAQSYRLLPWSTLYDLLNSTQLVNNMFEPTSIAARDFRRLFAAFSTPPSTVRVRPIVFSLEVVEDTL